MKGDGAIRWLAMAISTVLAAALVSAGLMLSAPDGPDEEVALQLAVGEQAPAEPPVTTATTMVPTTVAPATTVAPVTTRPRPVVIAPAPAPAPAPSPQAPASTAQLCADALAFAVAQGVVLPSGWAFRCPDAAAGGDGVIHAGMACMTMVGTCPRSKYVAINVDVIGNRPAYLRYVVVHEICHAIELEATGATTEAAADACAAAHGAGRP